MQLSKEQKELVERCGAALSKPSELARILGIPAEKVKTALQDQDSELYQLYYSGLETTKLELKESVIAIARQGSSPAQTQAFAILRDVELEMEED